MTKKIGTIAEEIEDLADAAEALIHKGVKAPTAPEIAAESWPSATVPRYHLDEVRRRMPNIRKTLRARAFTVVPVAEPYYHRPAPEVAIRRMNPSDVSEADISEAVAYGRGKCEVGILYVTDDDLLAKRILASHESWVYGTGAAKQEASWERLGAAVDQGVLSRGELVALTGKEAPEQLALVTGPVVEEEEVQAEELGEDQAAELGEELGTTVE